MKPIQAADILIDKIKQDYPDDVAVVVVMGSYIYNDTHSRSDLDLYFVPKTKRAGNLGNVFIIDGIGFDLWPISWERLESIANHQERITSIVTEGRILYCGSDEDLARFNQLKALALDTTDKQKFVNRAQKVVEGAYKDYFKMSTAQAITDARMGAMAVIFSVTYAIALLNCTTVKRGRGKLKQEILAMSLVPKDFALLYDTVFVSNDVDHIRKAYGQLLKNTEDLIQSQSQQKSASFVNNLTGYYEEMINFYNKIYHACEVGDTHCQLFAAVELTNELESALAGTDVSLKEFPDIVGAFDPNDPEGFLLAVRKHQDKTVEVVQQNGVPIQEFRNFEELKNFMSSL